MDGAEPGAKVHVPIIMSRSEVAILLGRSPRWLDRYLQTAEGKSLLRTAVRVVNGRRQYLTARVIEHFEGLV